MKIGIDQREIFVLGCATRDHEGGKSCVIVGEFAEHEADFAGVDILLLQLLERRLVEIGAMRARSGRIFDDRDLGIVRAHGHLADWRRFVELRNIDRSKADSGQPGQSRQSDGAANQCTSIDIHPNPSYSILKKKTNASFALCSGGERTSPEPPERRPERQVGDVAYQCLDCCRTGGIEHGFCRRRRLRGERRLDDLDACNRSMAIEAVDPLP